MLTAIRLASSRSNNFAADRGRFILEIDINELLPIVVAHDEAGVVAFFDGPLRREAAGRHCKSAAVITGASCSDTNECNIRSCARLVRLKLRLPALEHHLEHRM